MSRFVAIHVTIFRDRAPAEKRIAEFTLANIPEADQSEFERLTLQELYSVHEGNCAVQGSAI